MQTVEIYKRLSHRFNPGWSSRDNWAWLGTLKLTPAKVVREGNGYDDGGTYLQYARIPADVDRQQLAWAVQDTMSGSSCRHEYDCCGCQSTSVRTKFLSTRLLQVRVSVSYNY